MNDCNILIREFREEDAEAVSCIIQHNLTQVNSKDYPEKIIDNMCKIFTSDFVLKISQKRNMYVATNNDMVVGIASIEDDTIYTVFIKVEYHGKGIGKKLMKFLEDFAVSNGLQLLRLPASITAVKFYEKLGYYAISEVESEEYGRDIIMEKSLI